MNDEIIRVPAPDGDWEALPPGYVGLSEPMSGEELLDRAGQEEPTLNIREAQARIREASRLTPDEHIRDQMARLDEKYGGFEAAIDAAIFSMKPEDAQIAELEEMGLIPKNTRRRKNK